VMVDVHESASFGEGWCKCRSTLREGTRSR
jgi:hypothetical protein